MTETLPKCPECGAQLTSTPNHCTACGANLAKRRDREEAKLRSIAEETQRRRDEQREQEKLRAEAMRFVAQPQKTAQPPSAEVLEIRKTNKLLYAIIAILTVPYIVSVLIEAIKMAGAR